MNDPGQLVVAILGLLATVAVPIVVSRQTHPRRQVRYFVEVLNDEALLAGADGIPLTPLVGRPDLAVVSVRLWSSGPSRWVACRPWTADSQGKLEVPPVGLEPTLGRF